MPETNIFDDLLTRSRALGEPIAQPSTAQERVAELPRTNDPTNGHLFEQFLYGKATEAAPTPGSEFENFFRSKYSPAQEFISNFIRGGMASQKGVEAHTIREESLHEWQIFQKEQQANKQAQIQTLGLLTDVIQHRERLAEDQNQAKTASDLKRMEFGWQAKMDIVDATANAIQLEKEVAAAGVASESTKQQIAESKARVKESRLANPTSPEGIAYRTFQVAHNRDPESSADLKQVARDTQDLVDAGKGTPEAGPTVQALGEEAALLGNQYYQTADMNLLNGKTPREVKMAVLRKGNAEHTIIGYADPKFTAKVTPALTAAAGLDDFNALLADAKKTKEGQVVSGVSQRVLGLYAKLEGTLGIDTASALVEKLTGVTGIGTAKGLGELRTTDSDAKISAKFAGTTSSTWKELAALERLQKRRFYGNVVAQTKGLVQLGGPPASRGPQAVLKYEDMDEHLAEVNIQRQAAGKTPLNIAEYVREALQKGWSFK